MIKVNYNGYNATGNFSFYLKQGTGPSTGSIAFPLGAAPTIDGNPGTLAISCDGQSVVFNDVYLVNPTRVESEGGQILQATLADKRYRWRFGYLRAKYNQLDPTTGKPKEDKPLTEILTEALSVYNESPVFMQIPDDIYPTINWEFADPAQAIEELLQRYSLALSISPAGQVTIASVSYNQSFTQSNVSYHEYSNNRPLEPIGVIVVGDFMEVMRCFNLKPVGIEISTHADAGQIKEIDDLSYKPAEGWGKAVLNNFESLIVNNEPWKEAQALARQCIFKWYGYIPEDESIENSREQLLPWLGSVTEFKNNELVKGKPYILAKHQLIDSVSFKNNTDGNPIKSEFDFSLDYKNGILKFTNPTFKKSDTASSFGTTEVEAAEVELIVSVKTTPTKTNGYWGNYYYEHPIGGVLPYYMHKEESLKLYGHSWHYTQDRVYNKSELDTYAEKIARLIAKKFDTIRPEQYTFERLLNVTPIGQVKSVSWHVDEHGWKTIVSFGQEEIQPYLPSYQERVGIKKTDALHWPVSQLNKEKMNQDEAIERTN